MDVILVFIVLVLPDGHILLITLGAKHRALNIEVAGFGQCDTVAESAIEISQLISFVHFGIHATQ